jgi:Integrase core domain
MGSVGDCYDNALIEAFWSRKQVELLNTRRRKTRVALANAIFEHIEIFHNRCRRHSALGMRTPIEYEKTTPRQRPREPRRDSTKAGVVRGVTRSGSTPTPYRQRLNAVNSSAYAST